ncbi:hypothetical protein [Natronohydrobacter thiooxidans]|jgi:hypothetical protein|uniref:hypothetical protein n=1 Tax=Natronohydrobacter thiooxidans TaxID=87172 RepID=UPI0008FF3077|nr:hypothetical protein [Natronohydrobacter thiooxidans]
MALLRSASSGHRAVTWSNWLFAYLILWALPIPVGISLSAFAMLWRWSFEALGASIPAETVISVIFGIGVFLIMMPVFSWIGLVISFPIVWLVLRLGLGGWLSFILGGSVTGWAAAGVLGGMAPEIPIVLGVVTALVLRWMLGKRAPGVFTPDRRAGDGSP